MFGFHLKYGLDQQTGWSSAQPLFEPRPCLGGEFKILPTVLRPSAGHLQTKASFLLFFFVYQEYQHQFLRHMRHKRWCFTFLFSWLPVNLYFVTSLENDKPNHNITNKLTPILSFVLIYLLPTAQETIGVLSEPSGYMFFLGINLVTTYSIWHLDLSSGSPISLETSGKCREKSIRWGETNIWPTV